MYTLYEHVPIPVQLLLKLICLLLTPVFALIAGVFAVGGYLLYLFGCLCAFCSVLGTIFFLYDMYTGTSNLPPTMMFPMMILMMAVGLILIFAPSLLSGIVLLVLSSITTTLTAPLGHIQAKPNTHQQQKTNTSNNYQYSYQRQNSYQYYDNNQRQRSSEYSNNYSSHTQNQPYGKDYYSILGVDKKASSEEIKKAYRFLSKQFHPDLYKDNPVALRKMKELNEAYSILSDPAKRASYDRTT